jgi:hypothetical protein
VLLSPQSEHLPFLRAEARYWNLWVALSLLLIQETHIVPIVHGIVKKQLITLFDAKLIGSGFAAPGYVTTRYRVSTVLFGKHVREEVRAKAISCQINVLSSWSELSGLSMTMSQNSAGELIEYSQSYSYPDPIAGTFGNLQYSIETGINANLERKSGTYQIHEYHHLRLVSNDDLTLTNWVEHGLVPWQSFLTLATREVARFTRLFILVPEEDETGQTKNRRYEVHMDQLHWTTTESELLEAQEMLFSRKDLNEYLPEVLNAFARFSERSTSIPSLVEAITSGQDSPIESRFFEAARSLEAYHREHIEEPDYDDSELDRHREGVIAGLSSELPQDFSQWVRDAVNRPFEEPLRARLKTLVDDWRTLLEPLLRTSSKRKSFIHKTLETRNCYVHGSARSCEQAATGADLAYIEAILRLIAEAILLREMSVPPSSISDLFRRKEWFRNIERFKAQTGSFA